MVISSNRVNSRRTDRIEERKKKKGQGRWLYIRENHINIREPTKLPERTKCIIHISSIIIRHRSIDASAGRPMLCPNATAEFYILLYYCCSFRHYRTYHICMSVILYDTSYSSNTLTAEEVRAEFLPPSVCNTAVTLRPPERSGLRSPSASRSSSSSSALLLLPLLLRGGSGALTENTRPGLLSHDRFLSFRLKPTSHSSSSAAA